MRPLQFQRPSAAGTERTKPLDIASYALLRHLLAGGPCLQISKIGARHLYSNDPDQARAQLTRTPGPPPRLGMLWKAPSMDEYFAIRV